MSANNICNFTPDGKYLVATDNARKVVPTSSAPNTKLLLKKNGPSTPPKSTAAHGLATVAHHFVAEEFNGNSNGEDSVCLPSQQPFFSLSHVQMLNQDIDNSPVLHLPQVNESLHI
uniref:Uncharacterized protein n=1 Tax=Ditylenchus dipsaci TaxID=166011 RepID=A0A915DDL6_9BILA